MSIAQKYPAIYKLLTTNQNEKLHDENIIQAWKEFTGVVKKLQQETIDNRNTIATTSPQRKTVQHTEQRTNNENTVEDNRFRSEKRNSFDVCDGQTTTSDAREEDNIRQMRTTRRMSVARENNEYRMEEHIRSPERRTRAIDTKNATQLDDESRCSPRKQKHEKGWQSHDHEAEQTPYDEEFDCDRNKMEYCHGTEHIAKFRDSLPRQHTPIIYDRTTDKYGNQRYPAQNKMGSIRRATLHIDDDLKFQRWEQGNHEIYALRTQNAEGQITYDRSERDMRKAEDGGHADHSLLSAFDTTILHSQEHRNTRGKQDTFEQSRAAFRARTQPNTRANDETFNISKRYVNRANSEHLTSAFKPEPIRLTSISDSVPVHEFSNMMLMPDENEKTSFAAELDSTMHMLNAASPEKCDRGIMARNLQLKESTCREREAHNPVENLLTKIRKETERDGMISLQDELESHHLAQSPFGSWSIGPLRGQTQSETRTYTGSTKMNSNLDSSAQFPSAFSSGESHQPTASNMEEDDYAEDLSELKPSFSDPIDDIQSISPPSSSQPSQTLQIPTSQLMLLHKETAHRVQITSVRLQSLQSTLPPLSTPSYMQALRALQSEEASLRQQLHNYSREIEIACTASVRQLQPWMVAYQLCCIEGAIFRRIRLPNDLLTKKNLHLQQSTDFFNYLTRLIEHSILEPKDAASRAATIRVWIKIASRLYNLRNYSSLKALTSALSTPPIQRLAKTWHLVPKKHIAILAAWNDLLSEQDNYKNYRSLLAHAHSPAIPFLGVVIYDLTYLRASRNIQNEPRVTDILTQLDYFQSGPAYEDDPSLAGVYTKDDSHERLNHDGLFILHWILTRTYLSEKSIDELSRRREGKRSAAHSNTMPEGLRERIGTILGRRPEADI